MDLGTLSVSISNASSAQYEPHTTGYFELRWRILRARRVTLILGHRGQFFL